MGDTVVVMMMNLPTTTAAAAAAAVSLRALVFDDAIICRPDLEVIWNHICSDQDLPPVSVSLSIDQNSNDFPMKDSTIGIDSFVKFW